jgi:hypothetical protein
MIEESRMWENLLSSQPLCFNLFGELHFDLKLATKFFKKLFPNRIDTVTDILFEYSPGRKDKRFTGDRSAFDAFIEYTNKDKKGFIGIEVKYTESLKEESKDNAEKTFEKHKKEYMHWTTTDIFCEETIDELRKPPVSQIWRDHLLSLATKQLYDEGFFVFLFPKENKQCQEGVDKYLKLLTTNNEKVTGFYPRYLDDFIDTLTTISNAEWIKELKERYIGTEQE